MITARSILLTIMFIRQVSKDLKVLTLQRNLVYLLNKRKKSPSIVLMERLHDPLSQKLALSETTKFLPAPEIPEL